MPATSPYDMYCPIARALDVLGERWSLLILRELALGEQRFTDLRRSVVGIPPNVLSARLKALTEHGVVTTRELPPPAARTVYALTPRGREAMPVLRALSRWGFDELDPATPDTPATAEMVDAMVLVPYYDAAAAAGVDETYRVVVDGEDIWLSSVRGRRPQAGDEPDLTLEGPAWAFVAARQGKPPLSELVDDGTITRTKGSARTQRSFERIFGLA